VFYYNTVGVYRYTVAGPDRLAPGNHTVLADFKYDGGGLGKGGTLTLMVDGKQVAQGAFALVARLEECLGAHQPACHVAGIFMNIAGNLSRRAVGTTLHLEGTDIAIVLGCEIAKRLAFVHPTGGVQHLTVQADINTPRRSQRKSLRDNVPSSRSLASRTGMCGAILRPTSQPRKRPVP